MSRIILCVLSDLRQSREGGLPPVNSYVCESADGEAVDKITYEGRQTNEAPVRFLLDNSQEDITEVLYLCSESCRVKKTFKLDDKVALQLVEEGFSADSEDEEADSASASRGYRFTDSCLQISTERYFQESVLGFCRKKSIEKQPALTPIAYDSGNPELSIGEIVKHVHSDTTIDIDTTGGPRDAVLLMSLAVNVIFAQSSSGLGDPSAAESDNGGTGAKLGRTVYSDFGTKTIRSQNHAFSLFQLISAVQSFTRYGKADLLSAYFSRNAGTAENGSKMCRDIRSLCRDMEEFSNSLSLCRVGGSIQKLIEAIHCKLKKVEEGGEGAQDSDTGYILFRSLVSTIRERFIPSQDELGGTGTSRARVLQHIEIIRWCVDRQMIQQALAIYIEETPRCFFDAGFLELVGSDGSKRIAADVVRQLCVYNRVEGQENIYVDYDLAGKCRVALSENEGSDLWSSPKPYIQREMELALRTCWPQHFIDTSHARVTDLGKAYLPLNLAVYSYINAIRNCVMHVGGSTDKAVERFERFKGVANASKRFDFVPLIRSDIDMGFISSLLYSAADILEETAKGALGERCLTTAKRYALDEKDSLVSIREGIIESVSSSAGEARVSLGSIRQRVEEYHQEHADDFVFAVWDDLYPGEGAPNVMAGGVAMRPNEIVQECCRDAKSDGFGFRVTSIVKLKKDKLDDDDDAQDEFLPRIMRCIKSSRCRRVDEKGDTYVAIKLVEGMPTKKELNSTNLVEGLCSRYPDYFERVENGFCLS